MADFPHWSWPPWVSLPSRLCHCSTSLSREATRSPFHRQVGLFRPGFPGHTPFDKHDARLITLIPNIIDYRAHMHEIEHRIPDEEPNDA